jgi:16S rRNA processing protein RimM
MNHNLVMIGEIIAPRGLHGEVKVLFSSGNPHRLDGVSEVFLSSAKVGDREQVRTLEVQKVRVIKGRAYIKFRGVETVDDANLLRGSLILLPEESMIALAADEYFWHDLKGLNVVDLQGTAYGKVIDLIETGSNDVLVARQGEQEFLIPLLKSVIRSVDPQQKILIIDPLPGLFSDDED